MRSFKSFRMWQVLTFLISFLTSVFKHSSIGAWSMSKTYVSRDLGFNSAAFGLFDSVYLVFYSLGNFISGTLADHFPIRYVVSAGTLIAAASYFAIAALGVYHISFVWGFAGLFAINGLAQSGIYPGGVAVMSNWFSQAVRGRVMGFWSSNASVGEALGQFSGGIFFGVMLMSWEGVLSINASLLGLSALFFLFFIKDRPTTSSGLNYSLLSDQQIHEQRSEGSPNVEPIDFFEALRLPGVLNYGLSFAFAKLLQYAMILWLPYFLHSLGIEDQIIGVVACMCQIGGILGSILAGFISDRFNNRATVVAALLGASIPLLAMMSFASVSNILYTLIVATILGATVGGPANIISSACAADLATIAEEVYHKKAYSTVAGIIDGIGGIGAGLGQFIIGVIAGYSWTGVFGFLMLSSLSSALCLTPMVMKEKQQAREELELMP